METNNYGSMNTDLQPIEVTLAQFKILSNDLQGLFFHRKEGDKIFVKAVNKEYEQLMKNLLN